MIAARSGRIAGFVLVAASLLAVSPAAARELAVVPFGGRDMLVDVPADLPPAGTRALVVVLHGGLGNARRIASGEAESGLNLNAVAERNGFVVAYLNGTPVTRRMGDRFLGWNAGGCCGMSAENGIDDVAYIRGAVDDLARRYGIDRARVFGLGHSNGAMMSERLACETTLYAAVVAISGPLQVETSRCASAAGRRVLAIHGADDQNVPVGGGAGTKGLSGTVFRSQASARQVFVASGATYDLQVVPGADHALVRIDGAIQKSEGVTLAEKSAAFFGLIRPRP